MKTIKILFVTIMLSSYFSACGPIQGYSGPKLPDNQVAIVKRPCFNMTNRGIAASYVDGIEFCVKDLAVLPGKHKIEGIREQRGVPYNCYSSQEFDSYGYDSCRDDRESDIRNGKSPRSCDTYTYTKYVTECTVPFTKFICANELVLKANEKYVLEVGELSPNGGKMYLSSSAGTRMPVKCKYDSEFTRQERN